MSATFPLADTPAHDDDVTRRSREAYRQHYIAERRVGREYADALLEQLLMVI
jgi:hypothetical protein